MTEPTERLLDLSPALFVRTNREGMLLDVRGAWREILGWDPAELVGRHVRDVVHPDDLARATDAHFESYDTPASIVQYDIRMLHEDGSFRWISWSSPPPAADVGIAFGIDVTARRRQLEELEHTRSELRSLLETVPFYVTRIDAQGTVEYINRTYPGVTMEQVVGTNLLNWLPPEHRGPMQDAWQRVLSGEERVEIVVQGSGEHGTAWYRSTLGPIRRGDAIVGVIIAGEDITELRRAEERASQASRLEAIGRVAGAIAHDFNNMLAVMVSELELLELELPPAPHPARESLAQLNEAVDGASELTRGLSDAVRQKTKSDGHVDLVDGVRELETMLRLAAGQSIELHCRYGVERAVVDLARHELQQVLVNLLVNCREASGVSRVEIRVDTEELTARSERWLPPGVYACLTVTDDGPGIPESIRSRVAEPFVTTKESGTGFGLATCFALANARGGGLEVESPAGQGTRVRLLLPLRDEPVALAARPTPAPASTPAPAHMTLLLVEDHELARTNIARYLSRVGHRVLEARDGLDALEVLERHGDSVDVVVTDLLMPNCDGLELARRLRERDAGLPIVVMSGFCTAEQQAQLEVLDVTVLDKPTAPSRLLQELRRLGSSRPPAP